MSNDTPAKDAFGSNDDDAGIDASVLNTETVRTVDVENARPRTTETGVDLTVVARSLAVDVYDIEEYVTTFDDLRWEDAGDTVNVYALVTRVDNDETVILSDETASVAFEIPSNLDFAALETGDEVLLENVEVRASHPKLRAGIDTDVTDIDADENEFEGVTVDDRSVEERLDERSDLVNAPSWYCNAEKEQARARVVKAVVEDYDVKHVMSTDETWLYADIAWVQDGAARLKSILNDHLPSDVNTRTERNEIVEQVQLSTQTDENPFTPGPPDDPDLKWKVPVQNGLVDLREPPEQTVEPHAPEHYTTLPEVLDVEHDPGAECPNIRENLDKIARDDIMRRTIEEMMANILMRNNDYRKTYVNYGDEQTGKSFTDKLLTWLIGDDGLEHMAFERFVSTDDDFEADAARNAYGVIDDDASGKAITPAQCSAFKRFVGEGGTRTGAKNVKRDSHDPYATIKLNLNQLPVWQAWDGSIKSRLLPIFYTNQFVANPDPDDPTEHKKIKGSELERELRTDAELSGLLNNLIEAANRLYETEEWSVYERYYADMDDRDPEEAHEKLMLKYLNYADTTRRFSREFMVPCAEPVRVRKDDWHTLYRRRCDEEGIDPQTSTKFWEQIRNDDTVYVEFVNPYQEKRATEYVRPSKKALEYAPEPVAERLRDKIDEIDVNATGEVTRTANLSMGPVAAVEGRVVSRKGKSQVTVRIEDESGMVDVYEDLNDEFEGEVALTDGVREGDTVRVENATMMRSDDGAPQLVVGEMSSLSIEEMSGDDRSQKARVTELKNTIESKAIDNDLEGTEVSEAVDDVAEKLDVARDVVRSDYESLKHEGEVHEPAEGRVRTV